MASADHEFPAILWTRIQGEWLNAWPPAGSPVSRPRHRAREGDTRHLISKTVAKVFGTIMMDNYVLNRFLRKDAH
jgi:hypothetical protein